MTIGETKFSSPLFFCSPMYDFLFPYNIGILFYGGNIMKVLVINGPNLNMLGIREPAVYGTQSFQNLLNLLTQWGNEYGIEVSQFQSNHEGDLVDDHLGEQRPGEGGGQSGQQGDAALDEQHADAGEGHADDDTPVTVVQADGSGVCTQEGEGGSQEHGAFSFG